MKAKSISGKSSGEIKTAFEQSLTDGFKPTLALVFLSVKQDIKAIANLLSQHSIQVFGATSGGEIAGSEVSEGGISILLLDMDSANFRILLETYSGRDPMEVARDMTKQALTVFERPAFLLSNSIEKLIDLYVGEKILQAMCEVAGDNVNLWGGGAGDDLMFKETFVFNNTTITNQGILMLVLDSDKVLVKGRAASGMKSIGTEKVITRSDGNWILEIDGQPASDLIAKYMGETLTEDDYGVTNLLKDIFLKMLREDGSSIIRSVAGFLKETKGVAVTGSIKPGDKFRFTLLPDFDVLNEVNQHARDFQEMEMPDADALVMFSCIGRIGAFGPMTSEELRGVQNAYNVPMAGLFTYGEYGRATGGGIEFHNMTCCWVALKEKT